MLPDWFQNIKKEKETIHIPISDEDPITKMTAAGGNSNEV